MRERLVAAALALLVTVLVVVVLIVGLALLWPAAPVHYPAVMTP